MTTKHPPGTLTLPTPDLKAAVATCAKVTQPGHPALAGIHLAATAMLTLGARSAGVTLALAVATVPAAYGLEAA